STGLHMTYTGEKLSPSDRMEVYHGTRRLSENRDYTVSCVNNLHASDLSANGTPNKAPTVTVRGKGNYGGSRSFTFAIDQAPMSDATVEEGTDKTVPAAKKMRLNRIKPTVRYEGQLLKAGRDYSLTYYEGDTVSEEHRIADPSKVKLTEAGKDYCIRISASVNGDFTGECAEVVRVHTIEGKQDPADPGQKISMTKVKIAGLAASVEYTGGIITPEDLFRADKITQNPGADGPWKEVTLYRTDPATKKKLALTRSTDGVTGDYYIKMSASAATGKRVITFIGINGYSGRIKRTITVKPYHVKNNTGGRILVEDPAPAVFCKSGAKPSLTVRFVTEWKRDADNRPTGEPAASVLLKEGIDYLPLYQNNKQVDESGMHVFVSIRGIGNFTGSGQRKGFAVNKASITEQVTLTADDVIWRENGKDGYFKVMPTLTDGAAALKIAKNKDVEPIDKAALNYEYAEDTVLSDGVTRRYKGETALDTDRPAPGTWIRVSAGVTCGPHSPYFCDEGKEAVLEGYYRIIGEDRSIAGYIVEVRPSDHLVFCGADAVIPCKATDLIVREKGKGSKNANPLAARDIEILSADNNRFPGTARLLLHGLGEYGGYKTISFRIRSRRFDG
ncbi:MAG: hypothetical protein K5696_07505, partial [Lachnospiraceae bacterium]|nr:hypothetical protein [Lachnospiraceae bacterium]